MEVLLLAPLILCISVYQYLAETLTHPVQVLIKPFLLWRNILYNLGLF
uniref:Uncharacterized protein n=1 Tax=virus sp. ctPYc18 TaxID=2828251 RepID=A0A8S5RCB3_9VIRU|nr:MAG TPA: hypothetical protein [virus sp. ctPYc18]